MDNQTRPLGKSAVRKHMSKIFDTVIYWIFAVLSIVAVVGVIGFGAYIAYLQLRILTMIPEVMEKFIR